MHSSLVAAWYCVVLWSTRLAGHQHVAPTHALEVDGGIKLPLFCHVSVVRIYIHTCLLHQTRYFLCVILPDLEFILTRSKHLLLCVTHIGCTKLIPPSF